MPTFPGKESHLLPVPLFDPDQPQRGIIGQETQNLTQEDLYEYLDEIAQVFPQMPLFEILRTYFGPNGGLEVCPTAFMDSDTLFMLETEQACREYYKLPYEGGLWDQPQKVINYFTQIRMARNEFERARMASIEKSTKKPKDERHLPKALQSGNLSLPPRRGNLGE